MLGQVIVRLKVWLQHDVLMYWVTGWTFLLKDRIYDGDSSLPEARVTKNFGYGKKLEIETSETFKFWKRENWNLAFIHYAGVKSCDLVVHNVLLDCQNYSLLFILLDCTV